MAKTKYIDLHSALNWLFFQKEPVDPKEKEILKDKGLYQDLGFSEVDEETLINAQNKLLIDLMFNNVDYKISEEENFRLKDMIKGKTFIENNKYLLFSKLSSNRILMQKQTIFNKYYFLLSPLFIILCFLITLWAGLNESDLVSNIQVLYTFLGVFLFSLFPIVFYYFMTVTTKVLKVNYDSLKQRYQNIEDFRDKKFILGDVHDKDLNKTIYSKLPPFEEQSEFLQVILSLQAKHRDDKKQKYCENKEALISDLTKRAKELGYYTENDDDKCYKISESNIKDMATFMRKASKKQGSYSKSEK
ncbi:MAG: hypothetical protein AB7U85_01695 [Alphaproteobacteria bacterium]